MGGLTQVVVKLREFAERDQRTGTGWPVRSSWRYPHGRQAGVEIDGIGELQRSMGPSRVAVSIASTVTTPSECADRLADIDAVPEISGEGDRLAGCFTIGSGHLQSLIPGSGAPQRLDTPQLVQAGEIQSWSVVPVRRFPQ